MRLVRLHAAILLCFFFISCATSKPQGDDESRQSLTEGSEQQDEAHEQSTVSDTGADGENTQRQRRDRESGEAPEQEARPKVPPVLEAKAVTRLDTTDPKSSERSVTLDILKSSEKDPVADVPDPAPRELLTSFHLAYATGRNRGAGFTSGIGVEPYASEVAEVAPRLDEGASRQYELWFLEPYRATLHAYQDAYGGILRIESFDVLGRELHLVVFARSTKLHEKVSIFDEQYSYTAVAFETGPDMPDPLWAVDLSDLFGPYREIDDIQLGPDGRLFVNSNYPSYAKEVDGETAYLFAIEPREAEVLWTAGPLVSRGEFLVKDDILLAGYGFTAEPDYLYALDVETGAKLDRVKIPTAHDRMRIVDAGVQVVTYDALLMVDVED